MSVAMEGQHSLGRPKLSDLPVEEMLRRARAGDEDALEELIDRARALVAGWASRPRHRSQPGGTRPSDIAQEVALRAFRSFSAFRGETEAEWYAWLKQISLNQAAQLLRDAGRQKREAPDLVTLDDPEAQGVPAQQKSPSQATAHQEDWYLLLANLFQLPESQRAAIYLCHLKELSVAEAARQMNRTAESVTSLLQRGMLALRSRMAGDDSEPSGLPGPWIDAAKALVEYLRRRDGGENLDPAAFAAMHPACADELRVMFHWIERLQALRPSLPT